MDAARVALWGLACGVACVTVALLVSRADDDAGTRDAREFYVLAWCAFAASSFLSAAQAALAATGAHDVALMTTLRLGAVLAVVLAATALFAAAAHLVTASGAVKAALRSRRA